MAKKWISLVLVLALAVCLCPVVPADAAQFADETFVTVTVWNKVYRQLQVIPEGADLLFAAEDLAWMSDTVLSQSKTMIRFTRGMKTVSVQVYDPDWESPPPGYEEVVSAGSTTNTKKLISPAQKIGDTWYLSGASLLPWLNVIVQVDENDIMVRPSPESLWDRWDSFSIRDYSFDFVKCCEEIGVKSKDVEAAAYIRNNGLKGLLDLDLNNNGVTYQSTQNYNDLFDDFFKDKSATDQAYAETREILKYFVNLSDAATISLMAFAPEAAVITEALSMTLSAGEEALGYYTYISMFNEDNSQKLRIMDNFVRGIVPNDVDLDKNMKKAADNIRTRYRDLWQGIMQKALRTTVDVAVDTLSSTLVLKMLNLKWNTERPLNEKVNRIGMYDTIASIAKQSHNEGFGSYSKEDLLKLEDNTMLYLYCVEQNYQAMADYVAHNGGSRELMLKYQEQAEAAENAQALMLQISTYAEYDAVDTGKWSLMSKELQKGFEKLERSQAVHSSLAVQVDTAIYMRGLMAMNLPNLRWTRSDMDRDGTPEIFAISENGGECEFMVLDVNDKSMGGRSYYISREHYCAVLPTSDGVALHPTYGLEKGGILCWNGYTLEHTFTWSEGWEGDTFKDYFYYKGTECTYDVYEQKLQAAKIQDLPYDGRTGSLELDCPTLDSVMLSGDPDDLLRQIDRHMRGKEDLLTAKDVNFNLDEETDRIYILDNALSEPLLFARENKGKESLRMHSFFDMDWTVVLAERQPGGVLVRTYRIDEKFLEGMDASDCLFEGEVLSVGENDFYYSSTGDPFVDWETYFANQRPCLLDFLGMPEEEACNAVDAYFDYSEGAYLTGEFDGGSLDLYFELVGRAGNKVWGLTFYPAYNGNTPIDGSYTTANTRSELWENIFQPSEPWPELTEAIDPEGNVMYYGTTFIYEYQGERYWVTLCFYTDAPDSPLEAIGIMPVM